MSVLFEAAVKCMEVNGARYIRDVDQEVLLFTYGHENGSIHCEVRVYAKQDMAVIRAYLPIAIPQARRTEACRFASLITADMLAGCLVADLRDGEVLCRTAICGAGSTVQENVFERAIDTLMRTATACLPQLQAIAFEGRRTEEVMCPARLWDDDDSGRMMADEVDADAAGEGDSELP